MVNIILKTDKKKFVFKIYKIDDEINFKKSNHCYIALKIIEEKVEFFYLGIFNGVKKWPDKVTEKCKEDFRKIDNYNFKDNFNYIGILDNEELEVDFLTKIDKEIELLYKNCNYFYSTKNIVNNNIFKLLPLCRRL